MSLEDALTEAASETIGEPVLLSGYAAVVEVISSASGARSLVTISDTHSAPWTLYGMLQWASDEMAAEEADDD